MAVLLPIELYRDMQNQRMARLVSPRLVDPADAIAFRMQFERVDNDLADDAGF